jgi:hypothetical protein
MAKLAKEWLTKFETPFSDQTSWWKVMRLTGFFGPVDQIGLEQHFSSLGLELKAVQNEEMA